MDQSYYNSFKKSLDSDIQNALAISDNETTKVTTIYEENKDSGTINSINITLELKDIVADITVDFIYYRTSIKHTVNVTLVYFNKDGSTIGKTECTLIDTPDISKAINAYCSYVKNTILNNIPIGIIEEENLEDIPANVPMMVIFSSRKIPSTHSLVKYLPFTNGDNSKFYFKDNLLIYVYSTNLIEGIENTKRCKELSERNNSLKLYYNTYINIKRIITKLSSREIKDFAEIPDILKYLRCDEENKLAVTKQKDADNKKTIINKIQEYTRALNNLKLELTKLENKVYEIDNFLVTSLPFVKTVYLGSSYYHSGRSLIVVLKDIVVEYQQEQYLWKNLTLQIIPNKVIVIGVEDINGNYINTKTSRFSVNIHPHVNTDGSICHGSEDPIRQKYAEGKIHLTEYLYTIFSILSQYNPNSPYRALGDISEMRLPKNYAPIEEKEVESLTTTTPVTAATNSRIQVIGTSSRPLSEEDIIRLTQGVQF